MMEIMIARHAEKIHSTTDLFANDPLSEQGIQQALGLCTVVKNFHPTVIISSPLKRAYQTAEIIANGLGMTFSIDTLIREQESGSVSYLTLAQQKEILSKSDLSKGYITLSDKLFNGETYQELLDRARYFWNHLMEKYQPVSEDLSNTEKILVITHGRFMTFLVAHILGFPVDGFFLGITYTAYIFLQISKNWRPQLILPSPQL